MKRAFNEPVIKIELFKGENIVVEASGTPDPVQNAEAVTRSVISRNTEKVTEILTFQW